VRHRGQCGEVAQFNSQPLVSTHSIPVFTRIERSGTRLQMMLSVQR
jgi:hypothetical protein